MIYQYGCKFGHGPFDIYKPVDRSSMNELCPDCYSEMFKIYSKCVASYGTFKAGFYSAFGKMFTKKSQLTDEIKKLRYENGKDIVEVGDDKRFPKMELKPYPYKDAIVELRNKWRR